MVKLTKRKGFNFFRSYYDVYNELNDSDKAAFMDALLDRQFLGDKPKDLEGMAKFAYISQTNSIDNQVKGYEDKMKLRLDGTPYNKEGLPPTNGLKSTPTDGGKLTPTEQVEGKEKGEEKEKGKEDDDVKQIDIDHEIFYDLDVLIDYYVGNEKIVNAVISLPANKIKDKVHLETRMQEFKQTLLEQGRPKETFKEFAKYFRNWVKTVEQIKTTKRVILNPDNEKIIRFSDNVGGGVSELPESKFLELQEKMKDGGYIYKILN